MTFIYDFDGVDYEFTPTQEKKTEAIADYLYDKYFKDKHIMPGDDLMKAIRELADDEVDADDYDEIIRDYCEDFARDENENDKAMQETVKILRRAQ